MVLNAAPLPYVDIVKYLGFMFTPDSKNDADMQRQLTTFYARSNTILRQFAKCDESVKLVLFSSFCSCYYCPYLWLDMTKHSARILRVSYNNAHRKILKLHMRCSASQMFADNNLLNFEALMRKMSNTFISRLISSDNAIIKVLLDNMVARERECGNIGTVYYTRVPQPSFGYFMLIVSICSIQIYFYSYFTFKLRICFMFTKSIYMFI